MQIEQCDLVLAGVLGDAFERLFDTGKKSVAQATLALVEPLAGLLEIQRSEAAEANGPRQRGDGLERGREYRIAARRR